MRWTFSIIVCLLTACRHQPLAYTLQQQGPTLLLAPPVSKPDIKSARRHPIQKNGCDIEADSISLGWRGDTARVRVKAEDYYAPTQQPRAQAADPNVAVVVKERMYADTLSELEHFREALAAKEDAGCLHGDEAAHLRQSIAERFTFPPQIASFLRFGTYLQTGFIDLTPGFVLRLVSPTGRDPDVSFYDVRSAAGGDKAQLVLASGAGQALAVPQIPFYLRFLYWTGGSDHNFRTTIIGVPERDLLRPATTAFLANPDGYCAQPSTGTFCVSIAVNVGMNAGFYVRINGKQVFVRLGGQLGEAVGDDRNGMRLAGRRQAPPQNVAVRRMFRGRLVPVKADGTANLLSLTAMPGDEIAYIE
jgi:hypothetical protein